MTKYAHIEQPQKLQIGNRQQVLVGRGIFFKEVVLLFVIKNCLRGG